MTDHYEQMMSDCEHGFVTRDVCGDYKYICHECEERFTTYPSRADNAYRGPSPIQLVNMEASLKDFTSGVTTLKDAIQATGLPLEEFNEMIEKVFPAQITSRDETVNPDGSRHVSESYGPRRTSCPAEIDKIFSDPNVTLDDLTLIIERFSDIKYMDHETSAATDVVTIRIHFVDSSIQKVYYYPDYTSPLNVMRHTYANIKPQADWKWGDE